MSINRGCGRACSLSGEALRKGTYGSGERTLLGQLNEGVPDVGDRGGTDALWPPVDAVDIEWELGPNGDDGGITDAASTASSEAPCWLLAYMSAVLL